MYASAASVAGLVTAVGCIGQDQLYLRGALHLHHFRTRVKAITLAGAALTALICLIWPGLDLSGRIAALLLTAGLAGGLYAAPYLLVPQRALNFVARGRRELLQRCLLAGGAISGAAIFARGQAVAAGSLAAAALFLLLALRRLPRPSSTETTDAAPFLAGLPFAWSAFLYTAMTLSPPLALSAVAQSPTEVGELRLALTILLALQAVPIALNTDVFRSRLYSAIERGGETALVGRTALVRSLIVGVLLTAVVLAAAVPLTVSLYGSAYRSTGEALQILMLGFPLFCISTWAASALVVLGHESLVAKRQMIMFTALTAGLFVILFREPTATATAWATVSAEFVGLMAYARWTRQFRAMLRRE